MTYFVDSVRQTHIIRRSTRTVRTETGSSKQRNDVMTEAALHKTDFKILIRIGFRVAEAFNQELFRELKRRGVAIRIAEDEHRPELIDGQQNAPDDALCALLAMEFQRNREGSATIVEYYRWLRSMQKASRLSNADVAYIVERAAFDIAPAYIREMYGEIPIHEQPSPTKMAADLRQDLMKMS